jgi:hypothetical protein
VYIVYCILYIVYIYILYIVYYYKYYTCIYIYIIHYYILYIVNLYIVYMDTHISFALFQPQDGKRNSERLKSDMPVFLWHCMMPCNISKSKNKEYHCNSNCNDRTFGLYSSIYPHYFSCIYTIYCVYIHIYWYLYPNSQRR